MPPPQGLCTCYSSGLEHTSLFPQGLPSRLLQRVLKRHLGELHQLGQRGKTWRLQQTWAGVTRPHGVCCFLLGLCCLPTAHVLDTGRLAGRRREAGTDCPVILRASLRPWFHGCTQPGRAGHAAWPCGHIPSSATTMEGKTKGGEAQESLRKLPVTTLFLHRGSSPHSLPSSPLHFSLITQHVCSCMCAHTNTHNARAYTRLLLIYLLSVSSCQKVSSTWAGICLFVCSLLFPRIDKSA